MKELDNTISFDPPKYLDMCSGKTTQSTLFFRDLAKNESLGAMGRRVSYTFIPGMNEARDEIKKKQIK